MTLMMLISLVAACAPNVSSENYSAQNYGEARRVVKGVIANVRPVTVQGQSGVGTVAGGVIGGVAGSRIGGGSTSNIIGGVAGAVAGGLVGREIERSASKANALEYIIRLSDGSMTSVVQGSEPFLQRGQRVLVIYGRETRVIPDTESSK